MLSSIATVTRSPSGRFSPPDRLDHSWDRSHFHTKFSSTLHLLGRQAPVRAPSSARYKTKSQHCKPSFRWCEYTDSNAPSGCHADQALGNNHLRELRLRLRHPFSKSISDASYLDLWHSQ